MNKVEFDFQNANLLEGYGNADAGAIVQGVGAIVQGAGAISQSAKKTDSKAQMEAMCGKQPHGFLGIKSKKKKKQIAEWNDCVKDIALESKNQSQLEINSKIAEINQTSETEKEKTERVKKTILWIGIGVAALLVLSVTGVIVYKRLTFKKLAS